MLELAEQGITIYGLNYKDEPAKASQWLVDLGNPYSETSLIKTVSLVSTLGSMVRLRPMSSTQRVLFDTVMSVLSMSRSGENNFNPFSRQSDGTVAFTGSIDSSGVA